MKIRRVSSRQRRALSAAGGALTAAAQQVTSANAASAFRKTMGGASGDWHQAARMYVEHVGELQYFVSWRSFSASRCRLLASALDESGAPTGNIPDDDPNGPIVQSIVADIAGGVSGQSRMLKRAGYLLSVVGECWVGMVVRDLSHEHNPDHSAPVVDVNRPGFDREQWYVFGREQITTGGAGKLELKLPDGSIHTFVHGTDILFRVWDEHPFDPSQPVSPVWSNRDVLHEIIQTTATVDAANNSRLIGNGVWFVPQEMSLPQQMGAPTAAPTGQVAPTPDPDIFFEPNSAQSLQDLLFDVASTAKRDPGSQAAMLPIIAGVPGEQIAAAKDGWIKPSTEIPETALKTRDSAIRRLATGLDTSPERLLGLSTGNHWSAWAIDEQDVKVHIAPVVELIASAMTQEILRYKLAEAGLDPDAYVIWYDTTALTQDPDKTDEARDAFDRGAITAAALREHLGFTDGDGYDLNEADGWVQLALDKIAANPAHARLFMPILEAAASRVGLAVGSAPTALPEGNTPAEDDPADSEPEEPANPQPADEPDPSAAIRTVAEMSIARALELANKRRRTRTNSDVFRGIEIHMAHTRLDPLPYADVARYIDGWDTGVSDTGLAALGIAPDRFRDGVRSVVTVALATSTRPIFTADMFRRR